jgi:hypothetical protein
MRLRITRVCINYTNKHFWRYCWGTVEFIFSLAQSYIILLSFLSIHSLLPHGFCRVSSRHYKFYPYLSIPLPYGSKLLAIRIC